MNCPLIKSISKMFNIFDVFSERLKKIQDVGNTKENVDHLRWVPTRHFYG